MFLCTQLLITERDEVETCNFLANFEFLLSSFLRRLMVQCKEGAVALLWTFPKRGSYKLFCKNVSFNLIAHRTHIAFDLLYKIGSILTLPSIITASHDTIAMYLIKFSSIFAKVCCKAFYLESS